MPQIGKMRVIKKPSKLRICAACGKIIHENCHRYFGCAFTSEQVGMLFYHADCDKHAERKNP